MQIYVKNQFKGFHKYVNAPEEVAFLRNLHRHIFHIKTTIEVSSCDRELEFFMVQQEVDDIIKEWVNLEGMSCEQMASTILKALHQKHPKAMSCDVSEDGENGAVVSITKEGFIF